MTNGLSKMTSSSSSSSSSSSGTGGFLAADLSFQPRAPTTSTTLAPPPTWMSLFDILAQAKAKKKFFEKQERAGADTLKTVEKLLQGNDLDMLRETLQSEKTQRMKSGIEKRKETMKQKWAEKETVAREQEKLNENLVRAILMEEDEWIEWFAKLHKSRGWTRQRAEWAAAKKKELRERSPRREAVDVADPDPKDLDIDEDIDVDEK